MSCGRMPGADWPEPLPRLATLPGDPPALRRWLRAQAATEYPTTNDETPWPEGESA